VEDRANTNTSIIIYTYKYIQNMFPKVGILEETNGGRKEEKNDRVNNNEIHHICVGTVQTKHDENCGSIQSREERVRKSSGEG
jgi:hypothetical protein